MLGQIVDGVPKRNQREAQLSPESIAEISEITKVVAEKLGYDLSRHIR